MPIHTNRNTSAHSINATWAQFRFGNLICMQIEADPPSLSLPIWMPEGCAAGLPIILDYTLNEPKILKWVNYYTVSLMVINESVTHWLIDHHDCFIQNCSGDSGDSGTIIHEKNFFMDGIVWRGKKLLKTKNGETWWLRFRRRLKSTSKGIRYYRQVGDARPNDVSSDRPCVTWNVIRLTVRRNKNQNGRHKNFVGISKSL